MARAAAIVLAGGRSSRMGSSKAALDWHGSTLLRRVTGLLARAVDGPVIVVGAPGQELPEVTDDAELACDAREGQGPLQGIAAGLAALDGRAPMAYVSSTDVPLLHPAFVTRVIAACDRGVDIVLPVLGGYRQPLAAAYRGDLLATVQELIDAQRLRPAFLFQRCRVRLLDGDALLRDPVLAHLDPELASVSNLNEPADYRRAHALPAPEIRVQLTGALAAHPSVAQEETVRAWTVGQLAAALGLELGGQLAATLNGDQIGGDPQLPLVAGDTVRLLPS